MHPDSPEYRDAIQHAAKQCAQLIKEARRIAVFSGAGISTSAGIPDFRGPRGLYVTRQYDPEKVFDIQYFLKDAKPFYDFARDFINLENQIKPTLTHEFFAKLETAGKVSGIITQNIDSLHQRAGSQNVVELHGSFLKNYCINCREEYPFEYLKSIIEQEIVPHCHCRGLIKPDIVFFGEDVKNFSKAVEIAESSDLFFVIGSTCVVQPAAQIPAFANGDIVIVNKGDVELDFFNISLRIHADADEFFHQVHFYGIND